MNLYRNPDITYRIVNDYCIFIDKKYNRAVWCKKGTFHLWESLTSIKDSKILYKEILKIYPEMVFDDYSLVIEELLEYGVIFDENKKYDYCTKSNLVDLEIYYKRNGFPFQSLIELTNRCNLNCKHCYIDDKTGQMSIKDAKKVLLELRRANVLVVTFTGGELFLYPFWEDVLNYSKKLGFLTSIVSNLTLLEKKELKKIDDLNLFSIKTSIYGSYSTTHDFITESRETFERTIQNIFYLSQRNNICVNFVVTKYNVKEVSKIKNILPKNVEIEFNYKIYPTRSGNNKPLDLLIDDRDFIYLVKSKIIDPNTSTRCGVFYKRLRIDPLSNVYLCEYLDIRIGNAKSQSIIDIIDSKETQQVLNEIFNFSDSKCINCKYEGYCENCPAIFKNKNYDIDYVDQISCNFAKLSKTMKEEYNE